MRDKFWRMRNLAFFGVLFNMSWTLLAQNPVNPQASPEAVKLLEYLYNIQGKGIISGMHNEQADPNNWDKVLLKRNGGVEPALWGNDFRYGENATPEIRQRMIDEALHQWTKQGKIITLMYHQVQPLHDEINCCGGDPWSKSVHKNDLTVEDWEQLLTPGTAAYLGWKKKMDNIAYYLEQLQSHNVPVLFRPYHEMNGDWFWWCGKSKDQQYVKLYRQTFEYLTYEKKLNNVLWVLNYDDGNNDLEPYYPGDEYVDVIATDIYNGKFNQEHYQALRKVANDKPVAIGEVAKMISIDELQTSYPDYVWFMGWRKLFFKDLSGNSDGNSNDHLEGIYENDYVINRGQLPGF